MKKILMLSFVVLLSGCMSSTPPEPDRSGDLSAISSVRDSFIAAFNANDAEMVANIYSDDAVVMGGGQPTAQGRQAIVDSNKALFDQFAAKILVTPDFTDVSGDIAYDRGTFAMELTPKAGGPAVTNEGRYLVVLQRQADGSWKVTNDMDNSAMAPAPVPDGK